MVHDGLHLNQACMPYESHSAFRVLVWKHPRSITLNTARWLHLVLVPEAGTSPGVWHLADSADAQPLGHPVCWDEL